MFTAQPTSDGYAVVDADTGRPLTFAQRSQRSAQATANLLNKAAKDGPHALALALGCVDDDTSTRGVRF